MMQRICLKKSKIPCFERCKFLHPRGGFYFPSPPFRGRLRGGFLQVVTSPHPSPERGGTAYIPSFQEGTKGEVSSLETPPHPSPERGGDSKVEILQGLHPRRAVQKDIPPLKGEEEIKK
jgi:hypothetical protein